MIKTNKLFKLLSGGWIIIIFGGLLSCSSSKNLKRDFLYFQKDQDDVEVRLKEQLVQANDLLSIQVISRSINQQQTDIFNAAGGGGGEGGKGGGSGYLVSMSGEIEMPIIGRFKAAGLTRVQLEAVITEKLTPYVKDPSVFIRMQPFNINILGEVRAPGPKSFTRDRVTIIDAISSAGDLTEYGKRETVLVIREEGGRRKYFNVDLRSKALFQSPVYQLQANDIVYVEANDIKLKTLDVNPTGQKNWSTFLSIVSLVTTLISIGSLIIAVSK